MKFANWKLERDADGIVWATLDVPGAAANTLGSAVLAELGSLLDELDRQPPTGLVIRSGKAAGFIAGADIDEFTRIDSAEAARALVERGWTVFGRLAAVSYPTLALIRGHCMGGGLELALACRYRIVVDEPGTKLALPEVMLGIVPGWGGMLRLPALIGPAAALDLMLTGKSVDSKKAKRIGLADDCVPARVMESAARIVALGAKPFRQLPAKERATRWAMNGPLRKMVADKARVQAARKVSRANYPAPFAIVDIWEKYGGNALDVPASDPSALDAIFTSPTARNLVRVFHLQERLKAFGKDGDFAPRHVHVVGAGVMGGDIAAVCALRGMTVTLQDQSVERIAPAIARAAKLFERRHKGDARQVRFSLDRLIPDPKGEGAARADVIIEAIFENLEVKRGLFAELEARARERALQAGDHDLAAFDRDQPLGGLERDLVLVDADERQQLRDGGRDGGRVGREEAARIDGLVGVAVLELDPHPGVDRWHGVDDRAGGRERQAGQRPARLFVAVDVGHLRADAADLERIVVVADAAAILAEEASRCGHGTTIGSSAPRPSRARLNDCVNLPRSM